MTFKLNPTYKSQLWAYTIGRYITNYLNLFTGFNLWPIVSPLLALTQGSSLPKPPPFRLLTLNFLYWSDPGLAHSLEPSSPLS